MAGLLPIASGPKWVSAVHAIVSILNQPFDSQIGALWNILERRCGLSAIRRTPIVHFSWQIAAQYQFDKLAELLRDIARSSAPFHARSAGLALFTGEQPVLYIPIVRTAAMSDIHDRVWEKTHRLGEQPSEHYSPARWMPHITLAHGDLNLNNLDCPVMSLADRELNWEIPVDNLAVIYQEPDQVGRLRFRIPLAGDPR